MKQLSRIKKRKLTPGVKLGRPPTTFTGASQKREAFSGDRPVHITLRLRKGMPNLRTRKGAQIVRNAILGAKATGIRMLHFAILSNHIHLVAEGKNSELLYNAMKSFCSRLGIHIRRMADRRLLSHLDQLGLGIFRGRYDIQVVNTPTQMKNVLQYVLLNPAKHFNKRPYIDFFTSGAAFDGWKKLVGQKLKMNRAILVMKSKMDFLSHPELWLSKTGWLRA